MAVDSSESLTLVMGDAFGVRDAERYPLGRSAMRPKGYRSAYSDSFRAIAQARLFSLYGK